MIASSTSRLLAAGILSATVAAQAGEPAKLAPGVYFRLGDVKRGQANGGYIIGDKFVVAIEASNATAADEMLAEIAKLTDKPLRYVIITHGHWDHDGGVDVFLKRGVTVICHETLQKRYKKAGKTGKIIGVSKPYTLTAGKHKIELFSLGTAHSTTDLFVYLPAKRILWTGDVVTTMPAMWLGDSDLANWILTLEKLRAMKPKTVCPGHGPSGPADTLDRARQYLISLRDQVALQVCQGRSLEATQKQLATPHRRNQGRDYLIGVPLGKEYAMNDKTFTDHVKVVYDQLTSEPAPAKGKKTRALVLLGDHYHPPDYIRPPLESALEAAGIDATFVYDPTKLTAANLKGVKLLVVLRDGMSWPDPDGKPEWWMTSKQEKAIVAFVESGGGLLGLHNAMALKPWSKEQQSSAYTRLFGCSYGGHGRTDEKFTVKVVRKDHPVTKGIGDYQAVDERHTPVMLAKDVTVLLRSGSGEKEAVAGYVRTAGKGRVCYLANGHDGNALSLPAVQRLITNAAKWCSRKRN